MRTRPARPGYSNSIRSLSLPWMAGAAALLSLVTAGPSMAADAAATAEQSLLTGIDVAIVRPLSAIRAGVGTVLFVPAAILASPACFVNLANGTDCGPVYSAPYDVLIGEPAEYAFKRKMGEL